MNMHVCILRRCPLRQVLIRANTNVSDGGDQSDEPSTALSAAESAEACGSGSDQSALLLDPVPEPPSDPAAAEQAHGV